MECPMCFAVISRVQHHARKGSELLGLSVRYVLSIAKLFSCFSKGLNRFHRGNKLRAVLIEICALLIHGFTHQLDGLRGLGRL